MITKKLKLQGLIYTRYDDYANRLVSGWVQKMIIDELKEEGYLITAKYFSRCLTIAREKKLARSVPLYSSEKIQSEPEPVIAPVVNTPVHPKKDTGKFKLEILSDDQLF